MESWRQLIVTGRKEGHFSLGERVPTGRVLMPQWVTQRSWLWAAPIGLSELFYFLKKEIRFKSRTRTLAMKPQSHPFWNQEQKRFVYYPSADWCFKRFRGGRQDGRLHRKTWQKECQERQPQVWTTTLLKRKVSRVTQCQSRKGSRSVAAQERQSTHAIYQQTRLVSLAGQFEITWSQWVTQTTKLWHEGVLSLVKSMASAKLWQRKGNPNRIAEEGFWVDKYLGRKLLFMLTRNIDP